MKYKVSFIQYHTYEVEAETEDEAIELAEEKFEVHMHRPIAQNWYDEVEVFEEAE